MQTPKIKLRAKYSALKIAATYAAIGVLWILTSDKILSYWVSDADAFFKISIYKGWFFIFITAILLYVLIQNSVKDYIDLSDKLMDNLSELKRAEMMLNRKINELVETEEKLSASEERYRLVLESVKSGVWDYDINSDTVFFSSRFYTLTGREKLEETHPFSFFMQLIHPSDQAGFLKSLQDYLDRKTSKFQVEFRLKDVDDHYLWLASSGKAVWDGDTPLKMVGSLMDITASKADQDKILELAYYDSVTHLPNKAKLEDFTNTWLSQHHQKLALIYLDIDNFKMINDAIGHKLGDAFLIQIAERLKTLKPHLQMISRIGGDEFCFVVTQFENRYQLHALSEKILELIRTPWHSNDREFFITGSIGIAIAPDHGNNLDTLLKKADTAMYASKNAGRNQCTLFHEQLHDVVLEYVYLQSNMKRALENEAFTIYYQPQFNIDNNSLKGAEALVRWQDKDLGLISPDRFIGISEKTGFIKPLGLWIIEAVFKDLSAWRHRHYPIIDVSVNLSAVQLHASDFIESVTAIGDRYQIDPTMIIFEITENVAIDGNPAVLHTLETLREKGYRIALDDFGINYSSLSYLKRLPIDIIKLDKTFISQIDKDPLDLAISRSVISLAHEIGLSVVAEGVERISHYNILKELYCDAGQGYLFSRPIDAVSFERDYLDRTIIPFDIPEN
ncbi:EAL domain-containing protein [Fusibacter paucivorans]|uniref:EAL domain-containing protein n=1 Tax=Fusibacter paucivorans TaxID=76009 RepID=A0ABS5PS99_9FIRM|nr:GGDEF domain-containing phosphodiesterase [Fusibacter paucivorans]MBS7528028.1 EAL domain-containing protein [Fusibacter paucivorans]